MNDYLLRGRVNDDGSVDVWVGRRRLHFAGGGRKPTVVDDDSPPPDAGEVPRGVLIDVGDPVTMVSYDGWYARVAAARVDVNATRARRRVDGVFSRRTGREGS